VILLLTSANHGHQLPRPFPSGTRLEGSPSCPGRLIWYSNSIPKNGNPRRTRVSHGSLGRNTTCFQFVSLLNGPLENLSPLSFVGSSLTRDAGAPRPPPSCCEACRVVCLSPPQLHHVAHVHIVRVNHSACHLAPGVEGVEPEDERAHTGLVQLGRELGGSPEPTGKRRQEQ